MTASELDLMCQHKVNRRQIYVECKAHRSPLAADVLTKLLGTVTHKKYQEGWLISTGPLGKDAKGFQLEWEAKPTTEAQVLSIYTPERVIEALTNAGLIQPVPGSKALEFLQDEDLLGDWSLLITPYGRHWVATVLTAGVPEGTLVFSAKTGKLVKERDLLTRLSLTDTNLRQLDFEFVLKFANSNHISHGPRQVVEVQHGENWYDYRPARPEDFVGRKDEQDRILRFLESVRTHKSMTRVFAITGDSGMGKSSLIAKLRWRSRNQRYRSKFFFFAVDVRAATDSSYIYSSLLTGLSEAARLGFGRSSETSLRISNPSDPLASDSIQAFLQSLEERGQIVCIVFDQFEELYSKTEMFAIFQMTQNLLLAATSIRSNLVLGFAWKTDSTVQQDHPAYYLWHRLADHRIELRLRRFMHSEASSAITIFENEIGTKLRSDLRRQLIENSQGYPWLLKKLSIHVYEQVRDGLSQSEIMNKALDVESLFQQDLQQLTRAEDTCLRIIASTAPADWYEILESSDQETVRSLLQRRLIVRSGDRINVYWDIFREYILSGTVPSIPLTYFPTSPSLRTMLAVAQLLDHHEFQSHTYLGKAVGISEKSVGNIVRDLIMFGIAKGSQSQVALSDEVPSSDPKVILRWLRNSLKNHALTISLHRLEAKEVVTVQDIIDLLREINPAAQHQHKTWKMYAERMAQLLSATGFCEPIGEGWQIEDRGEESISSTNALIRRYYTRHPQQYRENTLFIGDTSPYRTVQALEWILTQPPQDWRGIVKAGHRNGARSLINLRLIHNERGKYHLQISVDNIRHELNEAIWLAVSKEPVMELVIELLHQKPTASGREVGELVASRYEREWTLASIERIGNSLRQWAAWLIDGRATDTVPEPPGRAESQIDDGDLQLPLL